MRNSASMIRGLCWPAIHWAVEDSTVRVLTIFWVYGVQLFREWHCAGNWILIHSFGGCGAPGAGGGGKGFG